MSRNSTPAVPGGPVARLSHVGLRAGDIERMLEFYVAVLGLHISDRGTSARQGLDMVFMTGDASVHHQFVLVGGTGTKGGQQLEHLAFEVDGLAALRAVRDRAVAAGRDIRTSDHGNAWSIYFSDPDGNGIEVFARSPFQWQQPFGRPFDLDRPDAEIISATRALCDTR